MAYRFFHFPVAILAYGITKASLIEMVEYYIYSYMEECEVTFAEACKELGLKNWNEEECRATFEHYKNCRAKTSIRSDQYWQWRNNVENESDYSKLLLLGFLAVKSIVGQKNYALTNYDFLLARMAGDSVPRYKTQKGEKLLILPPHIKPINTRCKLEKLRDHLAHYHVTTWGQRGLRGFAVSTKLSDVELAHAIATNGTKSQAQARKERKERIKAEVKKLQGLSD